MSESLPPPPDRDASLGYSGQTLRQVVFSDDEKKRAVITQDAEGRIRLHFEKWDTGDWEVAGVAYWSQYGQLGHFVDSVDRAQLMAIEEFDAYKRHEERG